MNRWQKEKQIVVATALRLIEQGLVIGSSGNVSLRLPAEKGTELFAVTPTSRAYETLSWQDIPVVDINGTIFEGSLSPSIEANLHGGIYHRRRDVNTVIHTHSVYASAAAVAGQDIPPILDDQVIYLGGAIRCARYGPPGSVELAEAVIEALGERCGVLLRHHGALGCGFSAESALEACLLLEKTAHVFMSALSAGQVNSLAEQAVAANLELYRIRQVSPEG